MQSHWIRSLQQNSFFKFTSSVKLAVPLMLILLIAAALGTFIESRYNADYASLLVYRSWWFSLLLVALWFNILNATVARYPFKTYHLGFVITHLGLLTLLIGGMMTSYYGVDGQMRVVEKESDNRVVLPDLVFAFGMEGSPNLRIFPIPRGISKKDKSDLNAANAEFAHLFTLEKYFPFVNRVKKVLPGPVKGNEGGVQDLSLGFILRSPFFNVSEVLHTKENPEMKMGPATLRLKMDPEGSLPTIAPNSIPPHTREIAKVKTGKRIGNSAAAPAHQIGELEIWNKGKQQKMKVIKVSDLLKGVEVEGVQIQIIREYKHAVVSEKGLAEGDQPGSNPALELSLEKNGEKLREVVYAKYPEFSINKQGTFNLQFRFHPSSMSEIKSHPSEGAQESAGVSMDPQDRSGNVIEFYGNKTRPKEIRVELYKNGQQVLRQWAPQGGTIETPWMGMKIVIGEVNLGGRTVNDVEAVVPEEKQSQLPPSALYLKPRIAGDGEGLWLVEGDEALVKVGDKNYRIYYGREILELPFQLQLQKFSKVDYPGTETPMSYESMVQISPSTISHKTISHEIDSQIISMNEPLKYMGYTLYQSSYEQSPGMSTASIFSVNKDPGRGVKYAGSIILCLGIIIFTLMRSRFYKNLHRQSRNLSILSIILVAFQFSARPTLAQSTLNPDPASSPSNLQGESAPNSIIGESFHPQMSAEQAQANFVVFAKDVDDSLIWELPVQHNGRLKPFLTLARESVLFLSGKYSMWGLRPGQIYLALMTQDSANSIEIIEIRDPELRLQLGFVKNKRYYSLADLEKSDLFKMAEPLLGVSGDAARRQTPSQKKIVETYQQILLFRSIMTGEHLFQTADFSFLKANHSNGGNSTIQKALNDFMRTIAQGNQSESGNEAKKLLMVTKAQELPEIFQSMREKMKVEVDYNNWRLFYISGLLYLLMSFLFFNSKITGYLNKTKAVVLFLLPFTLQVAGFAMRVYITGFAPVTNMYGTMLWVSFGVTVFSLILLMIYENFVLVGMLSIASGLLLLLTENLPLVLSPDMDPIVAVLRSNFWLTIHVLTITISYAAFAAAMLIGNVALIRTLFIKENEAFYKVYSHYAYRMIQLGVFLISTGIILGGVWADYSWGRFWGWDPKETWALIADLGFLAILHAKYVGWLRSFGLLAAAPLGFLLVIMAWYGVNFILATGLHSYGFSSGGVTIVVSFFAIQLIIFAAALLKMSFQKVVPNPTTKYR